MRPEATSPSAPRRALAGARAILPLRPGVVPFGLPQALSARSAGLSLLAMGAVTHGLRLVRFALPPGRLAPFWARLLHFVPVTVFAALVATSVPGHDGTDTVARTLCLGLGAVALLRRAPLYMALLAGLLPYLAPWVAAPWVAAP